MWNDWNTKSLIVACLAFVMADACHAQDPPQGNEHSPKVAREPNRLEQRQRGLNQFPPGRFIESKAASPTVNLPLPQPAKPMAQNVGNVNQTNSIQYDLAIDLQIKERRAVVRQTVRWTNPGPIATDRLVFHVVANNRPTKAEQNVYNRTVESLRLDPRTAVDAKGGRFHLKSVTRNSQPLKFEFDKKFDTHLHVLAGQLIAPGESIKVELDFEVDIPKIQGRIGQHRGVTNLLNWYPVLAVFGKKSDYQKLADEESEKDESSKTSALKYGWDATPFVGWHQPWYNEVGDYNVQLRLPENVEAATGGHVVGRKQTETGHQLLQIKGQNLRDFTIVASDRFEAYKTSIGSLPIRVLAFPEHQGQARLALQVAAESIKRYSEWFGEYPYEEFELVESYFGWNGNESSGLVMIDARILAAPRRSGLYVEHLVAHEVSHQWWFSAVGTNGYTEPFMDEGIAAWVTRMSIEEKYGPDPSVIDLPGMGLCRLPNIPYRTLVHSGYDLYRDRGGDGKTLSSLDELGHVHNLFFLIYDRGARVHGMIQQRLGRDAYLIFLRELYKKYRFKILRFDDFQKELEAFTQSSWKEFFDDWLRSSKISDWQIDDVDVTRKDSQFHTVVTISQAAEIAEPVDIMCQTDGEGDSPIVRVQHQAGAGLDINPQMVPRVDGLGDDRWRITFITDHEPTQIEIDPHQMTLDANLNNNRWKPTAQVRYSPLFTPLDESTIVNPIDRLSIVFGPNIDMESRIGFRATVLGDNNFRISPFLAYDFETGQQHLAAGVDAIVYNFPSANWQLGARYEHALITNLQNDPGSQTRIYLRKVLAYTTSMIYPNNSYLDFYFRSGDNFFPDEDRTLNRATNGPAVQNYGDVRAIGVKFHADSRLPYWNPYSGYLFDAEYEHGFRAFGDGETYNRLQAQGSIVHKLPDNWGWLSETRLAGRLGGGYGFPDNGEHFRFGGPNRFRGLRADKVEGNAFWLSSLEWRFPLLSHLDFQLADNFAKVETVSGSLFYDFGETFLFDRSMGFEQAVGAGLYFDIPLLSFVERTTFRIEYGHTLNRNADAVWFGLYYPF
jgi:hypothetical protein